MKKYTINIIAAEKKLDDFYHAADLFEPFKRLGQNLSITYEFEKSEPDQSFVNRLKKQFDDNGQIVTALWIAETPEVHYVDWNVMVVSTGQQWFLLEKYLSQFRITKPESDIQPKQKTV